MKNSRTITALVILVMAAAAIASGFGVFTHAGPGPWEYRTVRGEMITIYGRGIYQHMSADVAVQGVGQDWVTLFLAVPLLGTALIRARRGSPRGRFLLAGVLGYFLVTYLFYLVMGMYNVLFLLYTLLLGTSFFAFGLTLAGIRQAELTALFAKQAPVRFCGGFLLFNTATVALLWLGVIVPPLLDGTVYPEGLHHYTTMIVQGLDLGLLLPLSAFSGVLLIRRHPLGLLLGPVYLIFLTLLMTALVAKIIAMGLAGVNVVPVVFIIPVITLISLISAALMLRALPGRLISSDAVRLARTWRYTGMIIPLAVVLNLFATGAGEAVYAGGLRETRRAVDAIEIGEIDPASISPGRYRGSFVAPLVSAMVEVTIGEGRIQSIEVLEHTHGPRHGAEAIVDSVLIAQSLQVDVISGATGSSRAILKAIENALQRR
jgi:uncharacterized protein with FMN-binding domain